MRAYTFLGDVLKTAVNRQGLDWPDKAGIEPPKDKAHGDLASNAAMILAQKAGMPPRELAGRLVEEVMQAGPMVSKAEVAGPGFINVFFSNAFWQQTIPEIQEKAERYGCGQWGAGTRAQVEYVSANPTGPLHIGHGRGAAVGDSLARILRAAGYEVSTEYYLNDAGRQMNLLGRSIWARYQQVCGRQVPLPQDGYQGEYILDLARELFAEQGDGLLSEQEDQAVTTCREWGVERILTGIRADLEAFRVEHQVWFSEQSLVRSGAVDKTMRGLQDSGLAYEQDGALWFASTRFGDDKDRVLRKSDGELTYFASDIAYHADKFARGIDLCIDVWGADHHGYVPRMRAAVQALGRRGEDLQIVLIQLVNLLRKGEQVTMSTRSGQFETLADVVSEVGADAARFIFLTRKSDSSLDMDLDLLKEQSMDNPVYYVQYAHARICSMLAKAGERGVQAGPADDEVISRLDTEEDLDLLKMLERFPETIQGAARTLSPHHVSFYLLELAGSLHRYYNRHQVLNCGDEHLARARLHLMLSVGQVVQNGLHLLGVTAPRAM
ncbi:MAG: arginine--tRNA ligase [Desulfovermiculus sp.]|nr:arginine--tRNA ligase [Desulfovermiculus sp.]